MTGWEIDMQNRIKIHVLPAGGGDCFLLEFLQEDYRIIIDGGYAETYRKYLKPVLKNLAEKGKRINLLVVTHIDSDHINGIKAFLEENGKADDPQIIGVDEVWYNGFFHINTREIQLGEIPYYLKESMQSIVLANYEVAEDGTEEVGVSQGNALSKLLLDGAYHWNSMFHNQAVCTEYDKCFQLCNKLKLTLLNPCQKQLQDLADYWIGELKKTIKNFVIYENRLYAEAFESYMQWENDDSDTRIEDISSSIDCQNWEQLATMQEVETDSSKTNRSSIAFMLEYEEMKLLFPGDCPIQLIMEELPNQIDFVKLPHHGSNRDICCEFLNNTQVSYYLLSTDGKKFGHPSKSVIANILCKSVGNPVILKNYMISFMNGIGMLVGYGNDGFTC